jgi:hypothetical protein
MERSDITAPLALVVPGASFPAATIRPAFAGGSFCFPNLRKTRDDGMTDEGLQRPSL